MLLVTNHYDTLRRLYAKIGLQKDGIDKRMNQAMQLVKMNELGSRFGERGKGVGCAYDARTGTYFPPLIAADEAEASALRRLLNTDADIPTFGMPSSGAPLPLLTIWTQRAIKQIFKALTAKLITGDFQQGTFGTRQIKIPTIGYAGEVVLYNDGSANGNNSYNVDYVTKDILYFETSLTYGDLEVAEWGLSKMDAIQMKRDARDTVTVPQFQNDLVFNGYTAASVPQIEGIINNSNLNAGISLPNDGHVPTTQVLTTAFSGKDYSQIIRDIQLLVSSVIQGARGTVTTNSKFKLALPPSAETALLTSTILGVTVKEQLQKMFPNMEIVVIPNFEADLNVNNQTIIMVLFEHPQTGEQPYAELFTTKYMAHRPVPMSSAMEEKISMGLGGAILLYPLYVGFALGC